MRSSHRLTRFGASSLIVTAVAFVLWTVVVFKSGLLWPMDKIERHPWLVPDSYFAQLFAAIAVFSFPGVFAIVLAGVAFWAWRRRLVNLAWGTALTGLLAWPGNKVIKDLLGRARPPSPNDNLISYAGHSYPSAHLAMVTATAAVIIAATTTTRQPKPVLITWRIVSVFAVLVVGLDQLILNAHWPSDVIGGILYGLLSAAVGLVGFGVHMLPATRRPPRRTQSGQKTAAVIYNPARVIDVPALRRHIEYELVQRGWDDALWLPTKQDDPGRAMAHRAVSANVDLVLVAGGDGTVREVCSGLSGSGIPLAVLPSGTGNLLARNLGIPIDQMDALNVAFDGETRQIDLVRVVPDGREHRAEYFAVMAGLGADARLMEATSSDLKRTVGPAAYFLAAASTMRPHLFDLSLRVDDGEPTERSAAMLLMGNMGLLQAGIELFPSASPTDGRLDVIVASPAAGVRDWATLMTKVVLVKDRGGDTRIDEASGRRVVVTTTDPTPYELDGDARGPVTRLEAEVVPGALSVRVPVGARVYEPPRLSISSQSDARS